MKKLLYSSLTTDELEVPDGSYEIDNMISTVVPNRNMIFLFITTYALSLRKNKIQKLRLHLERIVATMHYIDCTPEFYPKHFTAFEEGNWGSEKISLNMPYITKDKSAIVKDALNSCDELDLDFYQVMSNN